MLDESVGADGLVARGTYENVAALKGRRIGAETMGTGGYLLGRALEKNGLAPSDVDIVDVPPDRLLSEWKSSELDAVVAYDPLLHDLAAAGGRILFDSAEIPGEIVDVLVVRGDLRSSRSRDLQDLVQEWLAVTARLRSEPEPFLDELARETRRDRATVEAFLGRIRIPGPEETRSMIEGPSATLRTTARRIAGQLAGLAPAPGGSRVDSMFPTAVPGLDGGT